jgi:carbon storage regulator
MLVVSRKIGERLIIDGIIELEILQFRGKRVRLGVTAPRDVDIRRAEVPTRAQGTGEPCSDSSRTFPATVCED